MIEAFEVQCPYCGELVEVGFESDVEGEMVHDCEVCCRPWRVILRRDRSGEVELQVYTSD